MQLNNERIEQMMSNLKDKCLQKMKSKKGDGGNLDTNITVKFLGNIEVINSKGELVEKCCFLVQEPNREFKFQYYYAQAPNEPEAELLGIQQEAGSDFILSTALSHMPEVQKQELKAKIEKRDPKLEKTIEQLKDTNKVQSKKSSPKGETKNSLSKSEMEGLEGPKTRLEQEINGKTLGNTIGGLTGEYIQFVDAETIQNKFPELEIPKNQSHIPFEIKGDGTGTIIGNDKIEPRAIDGKNPTQKNTTITLDGKVLQEQNIATFDIVASGGKQVFSIGYDETTTNQMELKLGEVDRYNPKNITYIELEDVNRDPTAYSGTIKIQEETTDGFNKGHNIRARANAEGVEQGKETPVENVDANINNNAWSKADIEKYAKAKGLYKDGINGRAELDIEAAERELNVFLESGEDNISEIIKKVETTYAKEPGERRVYY